MSVKSLEEKAAILKQERDRGRGGKERGGREIERGREKEERESKERGGEKEERESKERGGEKEEKGSKERGGEKEGVQGRSASDYTPQTTPSWHPASRDWKICGGITLSVFLLFIALLRIMDVLRNIMLKAFFGIFLAFLGLITVYFFWKSRELTEYRALYLHRKRNSSQFLERFIKGLPEVMREEMSDISCISGHTFGLLNPVKAMRFPAGEIVEINEFQVSSGFVLGLYVLVSAHPDSKLWSFLDSQMK